VTTEVQRGPAQVRPSAEDQAAAKLLDKNSPVPLCGRCGDTSGPEGAWCDPCLAACKDDTLRLDLERLPIIDELGKNDDPYLGSLGWAAIFYARCGIPVHP
jgi:hypothetical protein